MRVCLISYEFPPNIGGEATYTHDLAVGLSSLGHDVTVVLPKRQGGGYQADKRFRILLVKTNELPGLKVAGFVAAVNGILPRLVIEAGIEVVHFTYDYPVFPVSVRGLKVPVVASVHHLHMAEALGALRIGGKSLRGLPRTYRNFLISLMEFFLVRQAAVILTVSKFTQKSLENYLGVPPSRTRVVLNGIQVDDLLAAADSGKARKDFGLGTGPFLLYVGRLEASKGLECLLDAFASVRRSAPSVRLVLIGKGGDSYTRRLKERVASLALGDSVTLTGRVSRSRLCEFYAASTALVSPSLMEGFGLSLVEAMAAGRPCIATRVGAVPEVVKDKKTGLLVPPADPKGLSEAMINVISRPKESARMGESARRLVLQEFAVDRMARDIEAVYAEITAPGKMPSPT